MKITKNLGLLLLAIYLILLGLSGVISFNFAQLHTVESILALAAGVLILFGR